MSLFFVLSVIRICAKLPHSVVMSLFNRRHKTNITHTNFKNFMYGKIPGKVYEMIPGKVHGKVY